MTPPNQDAAGVAEPLDDWDAMVLDSVRDLFDRVDPMPADLVSRVQFALALEDLDVEVFRLREELGLAATRGDDEQSRTITFDSENLTIMISISAEHDTVRLDGWIAPASSCTVEARTRTGPVTTRTDEHGRFVLERLPHGLAQLVVHPANGGATVRSVVTPSIVI